MTSSRRIHLHDKPSIKPVSLPTHENVQTYWHMMIYRRSLGVLQVTLTCWIVVVVVNADLAMNTIWNVYLFEHHGCMIIRGNLTCAEKLAKNHLSTYEETENNFPGGVESGKFLVHSELEFVQGKMCGAWLTHRQTHTIFDRLYY